MKTLILDFDGTIADTRESIVQAVQSTLCKLNLPKADEHQIKQFIGLPLKDTFERVANINQPCVLQEAVSIYRNLYNEISLSTVKLFPNVKNTLAQLSALGFTITVASSKGKTALTSLLKMLEIDAYISITFGEQDVQHKKPAPDMAIHILNQTHSSPSDTLVVGDTAYDIAMGMAAGCRTCGVSYGNHTVEQLRSEKADFIIDDFAKLIDILQ